MSGKRLTDARLAEIRDHFGPDPWQATHWPDCWKSYPTCATALLLAHVDAQQAELDRLTGQVATLREALVYACASGTEEVLADTEAAAREHEQRLRLEGIMAAREYLSTRKFAMSAYMLAALEREADHAGR